MYVGIDQSYSGFGLTFLYADGRHITEVGKFEPKRLGEGIDRLEEIGRWLSTHLQVQQQIEFIDHVCMEGYANGAKFGREKAGELAAIVKQTIRRDVPGIPSYPTIVQPTALKKYVTGSGTSQKNEILLHTYRKWGVQFSNDNAADSYGLARIARDVATDRDGLAYENEVLKSLRIHTEKR